MSFTDFFNAASRRHNDVILLPAICRVFGNNFVFQQDSAPAHRAALVQQLNCWSRNAKRSCVQLVASKQPTSQSCGLRDLACHAAACLPQDTSIVLMNWNGGSSMSGAVLNSRFLTRLLASGEEDIECMSMLNEDISSTACDFNNVDFVHIYYIQYDLFNCYIFNYEIMPATFVTTFLFILQGSALSDLRYGGRF